MSSDIKYNGSVVNSAVAELDAIAKKFPSISSGVKSATNRITAAKGFDQYVGGITNTTYSDAINTCSQGVSSLVQTIRQTQVKILEYSQDDKAIQEFLDTLDRSDYKTLDLSGIESHISLGRKASNVFKGIGASILGLGAGVIEGVFDFAETGADLIVLGGSAVASIFTSAYDALEGTNVTRDMWNSTKAFVSEKRVESAFNDFYANTTLGSNIKDNAYHFDTVRSVGKGLGYSGAMVVANAVTGGLVSGLGIGAPGSITAAQLATSAGLMGFSSGTEDAWADGATLGRGLTYGVATGAWNSAQWAIGAKINQIGGYGDQLASNVFKSATNGAGMRIGLSALDAGAEGFVQPGLSMIYKDYEGSNLLEQYGNAFQQAGGIKNVLTQAAIGGASATLGEVMNARKLLKEQERVAAEAEAAGATATGAAAVASADEIFASDGSMSQAELDGVTGGHPVVEDYGHTVLLDDGEMSLKDLDGVTAGHPLVEDYGHTVLLDDGNPSVQMKKDPFTIDTTYGTDLDATIGDTMTGGSAKNIFESSGATVGSQNGSMSLAELDGVTAGHPLVEDYGHTELIDTSASSIFSSDGSKPTGILAGGADITPTTATPTKSTPTKTTPSKIKGTNIDVETPFAKQLEGMSGYETYGASNVPRELVVDDMAVVLDAGAGNARRGIEIISDLTGHDSVQAVTAKGTVIQNAIQTSGGVPLGASYEEVARHVNQVYGSAGIAGKDVTLELGNYGGSANGACNQVFSQDLRQWDVTNNEAMKYYTGSGYGTMNDITRFGSNSDTYSFDAVGYLSQQIDTDFTGLQQRTILYRGIDNMDWVGNGALSNLHGQDLVDAINGLGGGVFNVGDNGFGSSTPVLGEGFTGSSWNKDVIVVASAPKGTKGAYVGQKSTCSGEVEYILQAGYGNKQMIYGAELIGSQVFVYTELI